MSDVIFNRVAPAAVDQWSVSEQIFISHTVVQYNVLGNEERHREHSALAHRSYFVLYQYSRCAFMIRYMYLFIQYSHLKFSYNVQYNCTGPLLEVSGLPVHYDTRWV